MSMVDQASDRVLPVARRRLTVEEVCAVGTADQSEMDGGGIKEGLAEMTLLESQLARTELNYGR